MRLVRALRAELGTDHGTVRRVADQLGFGVESVRKWVRQADIDDGDAAGTTTADRGRIWELEQENRELRRANANLACRLVSSIQLRATTQQRVLRCCSISVMLASIRSGVGEPSL